MPAMSVTIENRNRIALSLATHYLIYTCKAELDGLKDGLAHLGVLDLLRQNWSVLRTSASCEQPLLGLFTINWSPRGSNRREDEEAVI